MKESGNDKKSSLVDNKNTGNANWLKWSWIYGAAGGAAVVGAIWIGMATFHKSDPATAKVGNTVIHKSQFVNKLEASSGTPLLEQMIVDQLVQDGAKKYNYTASKQEIATAKKNIEMQNGITSDAQLSAALAQSGMTQSDFNQMLKIQVLEQKLSERGVTVTDKEIQDYYNSHKSSFTPSGSKKPQPLSAVKSQIKSLIKQSKATPTTQLMANLAKEYPITIYNSKFKSVKSQIEGSTASGSAANTPSNAAGAVSGTANATNSTGQ